MIIDRDRSQPYIQIFLEIRYQLEPEPLLSVASVSIDDTMLSLL
jgi:hypothetical protein